MACDRVRLKGVRSQWPTQPGAARNLRPLGLDPDGMVYGGAYQTT